MTITLSANADTFIRCADFAAMRVALGLNALATLIPGTGVESALGMPVDTPGGFVTASDAAKANLNGGNTFIGAQVVEHSAAPVLNLKRTSTSTSGSAVTFRITAISTGNASDGFGPSMEYRISDTGVSDELIGAIGFVRAGADNTGDFIVRPQLAGSASEKFRLKSDGTAIFSGPARLASYTVATVPSASSNAGGMIYVSNESGGATIAYSNGTNWKRVYDNANIS